MVEARSAVLRCGCHHVEFCYYCHFMHCSSRTHSAFDFAFRDYRIIEANLLYSYAEPTRQATLNSTAIHNNHTRSHAVLWLHCCLLHSPRHGCLSDKSKLLVRDLMLCLWLTSACQPAVIARALHASRTPRRTAGGAGSRRRVRSARATVPPTARVHPAASGHGTALTAVCGD